MTARFMATVCRDGDAPPQADAVQAAQPSQERAASGAVCPHCGRVHPRGQFMAGCPGHRLDKGFDSQFVRSGAATGQQDVVAAERVELRGEVGDVGVVKGTLCDRFVELSAVAGYLGARLEKEGPLTGRGRTRALLNAYLNVTDRLVTLARTLGIERQRQVRGIQETLAQAAAARREQLAQEQQDQQPPALEGGGE